MKIAIQGHSTRGIEVIQILESLGGKNVSELAGDHKTFYHIDDKNEISDDHKKYFPSTYKFYTIEEFEKEFPFKIGDKVIDYERDTAVITGFAYIEEKLGYSLQYENGRGTATPRILKRYKEMQERNITLTLEKAKEWYKKGGELKEIALQAFTERELNPLPRSWEEFCEKYPIKPSEAVICTESTIVTCNCSEIRDSDGDREVCPSKKSAEAHLAMIQLEQLRNCWRQSWEPDWSNNQQAKYCIVRSQEFKIHILYETKRFLSFPTREMAEEFLKCFGDLIEKAGDLI